MKKSIPTIREWEGNEKNSFPHFGNGKGMKKNHSHNLGKGIRGFHSWEWTGTGIPAHPCSTAASRKSPNEYFLKYKFQISWHFLLSFSGLEESIVRQLAISIWSNSLSLILVFVLVLVLESPELGLGLHLGLHLGLGFGLTWTWSGS